MIERRSRITDYTTDLLITVAHASLVLSMTQYTPVLSDKRIIPWDTENLRRTAKYSVKRKIYDEPLFIIRCAEIGQKTPNILQKSRWFSK